MTQQEKALFWEDHLAAWKQSGLSQTNYCNKHELKLSTFTYYRTKQRKPGSKLMQIPATGSSSRVELSLPGGMHLQFAASDLPQILPVIYRTMQEFE